MNPQGTIDKLTKYGRMGKMAQPFQNWWCDHQRRSKMGDGDFLYRDLTERRMDALFLMRADRCLAEGREILLSPILGYMSLGD